MTEKLIVFDTTLRDGEQSPGASMTQEEKVRIALQLEKLGVDIIEAGFAAASPGDFSAIRVGDYIADDIRRLLKSFVFRLFVHPLDCRGAASWGILIRCSWRL